MKKLVLILPLTLLASACTTFEEAGKPPYYFGSSVEQNIAAQIVDPDAADSAGPLVYEGNRAVVAQDRYVTDSVEEPKPTETSDVSASGGR